MESLLVIVYIYYKRTVGFCIEIITAYWILFLLQFFSLFYIGCLIASFQINRQNSVKRTRISSWSFYCFFVGVKDQLIIKQTTTSKHVIIMKRVNLMVLMAVAFKHPTSSNGPCTRDKNLAHAGDKTRLTLSVSTYLSTYLHMKVILWLASVVKVFVVIP